MINKEQLESLLQQGFSGKEIATYLGKTLSSVRHWLKVHKLSVKRRAKWLQEKGLRRCSKCKLTTDTNSFNFRSKERNRYQSVCKKCQHSGPYSHYKNNKASYIKRAKDRKHQNRLSLVTYLRDKSCVDCKESDIRVLDFDHKTSSTKISTISLMVARGNAWEKILEEISKCEIRCANCHRIKTSKQFGWKYKK